MPDLLHELMERRRAMLPFDTNAFRVSDGDTWRGVFVDALADRLLVSTRNAEIPADLAAMLRADGRSVYRKRLEIDRKEPPVLFCGPQADPHFEVLECGVLYGLDLSSGYSQGLFLDQRDNRLAVRRRCRPGDKVLNTFAYTGAFSVCAALAGAETTTLDLARPCLEWSKENFRRNGLNPEAHYFCKGDALRWLDRFAKQGRRFDGIILDPPTFSRDDRGRVWSAERDYGELAARAAACLAPGGWMLCSTNCRKLDAAAFDAALRHALPGFRRRSVPMPFDFTGEDYLKCLWCEHELPRGHERR